MKNIKMIVTLLISTIASSSLLQAAVENFELYNKAKTQVTLSMNVGDKNYGPFNIPPGRQLRKTIADNQPVYILLQEDPGYSVNIFKKILPTSKTKYISFSPDKSPNVYPQTGPWMGFMGTTESGLSLKNNIDRSFIEEGNMLQHQYKYE
jgi:hypothetical protein